MAFDIDQPIESMTDEEIAEVVCIIKTDVKSSVELNDIVAMVDFKKAHKDRIFDIAKGIAATWAGICLNYSDATADDATNWCKLIVAMGHFECWKCYSKNVGVEPRPIHPDLVDAASSLIFAS
jgi:hypothetical protein